MLLTSIVGAFLFLTQQSHVLPMVSVTWTFVKGTREDSFLLVVDNSMGHLQIYWLGCKSLKHANAIYEPRAQEYDRTYRSNLPRSKARL